MASFRSDAVHRRQYLAASEDTAVPMTRTVTDGTILLGALTGVDPKDPQTSTQIGLGKTDYTPYLKTDATIKSIDDDYNFINQYVADNPSATGPFKYGNVRIDSSHLIDLSSTSADTLKYLSDRALDLKNSQTLGIDKFLAEKGLAAIVYSGTVGAGIGAKEGYPTVIVQAGYQTLNNLNPLGISCLGKAYQEDKLLGYAYTY